MKIVFRLLLLLAAAGLGLAAGFAIRAKRAPAMTAPAGEVSASPVPALAQTSSTRINKKRAGVRLNDDSPLATQLERDLSMSSGVTRWLYWLDALEKAAPSDFLRLHRLAQSDSTAKRLVEARWIEVAPRHLFDTIVAGAKDASFIELARTLFDEWPKRDPEAAIAALNESAHLRATEHWRWTVAYSLIEKDIERGLQLMVDWHVDEIGFGPRGIAALTKWTRADPRHAAEFMLGKSEGFGFESAMETIGKEWAKIDPAGALAFATSKPGQLASLLATHALKDWTERNLTEAADWLATADERTRLRLSSTFVEAWAKQDAASALSWCEEHLTGSSRAQAVAGVLKGAAEKDVAAAATLVAGMPPSAARAEAAVAVAQKWFPDLASGQKVTGEPVFWLAHLDSDSVRRVLDKISWSWATSDPKSMAAFLTSSSSEQIPPHAYALTARELARRNPSESLEWASHLPGERALSAGGAAFGEWRGSQPDAAMEWLNALPATDPRRQPYFEAAIQSLAYHPQAAEQLAAMNPTERAAARKVIGTMNLPADRRTRLLNMLKPR